MKKLSSVKKKNNNKHKQTKMVTTKGKETQFEKSK